MKKRGVNARLAPYLAGLAAGYAVTAAAVGAGALIMELSGADSGISWVAAMLAAAAGSFFCGRTAGKLRRRAGLSAGALCGALYFAPLLVISLVAGGGWSVLLPVKLVLCLGFAAAGGVSGVNSPEKR